MWKIMIAAAVLAVSSPTAYAAGPKAGIYTAKFGDNECGQLNILASGKADYKAYRCNNPSHVTYDAGVVTIEDKGGGQYLFKIDHARYDAKQSGKIFKGRWSLNGWTKNITFR